jgi:hypothetical protein
VNFLRYSNPIEYSHYNEITLKDFKGLKRIGENLDGSNGFAYITTEIKVYSDNDKYKVMALFHPSRSYVFNENTIGDKSLLTHELYHFQITEYIVRQLRKKFSEVNQIDANNLLEEYKAKEDSLQLQYDTETYHSYLIGKQLAWQIKIDSLLNTLEKYH